jgi:hypothetical protein
MERRWKSYEIVKSKIAGSSHHGHSLQQTTAMDNRATELGRTESRRFEEFGQI